MSGDKSSFRSRSSRAHPPGQLVGFPDYHTHTSRCGHAEGTAAEYVEAARRRGLPGIGIADHLPLVHLRDPVLTMAADQLEGYVEEVLELKERYPGYVLLGIEADYRPDTVEEVQVMLGEYPFDYVIGSVHYLEDWGFDDPRQEEGFRERDVDDIYRRYFEVLGEAAETGLFDILGHLDLVKKFGHRARATLLGETRSLADRLRASGIVVEINTAGLRKAPQEVYPAPGILSVLAESRVPITFGSDAHTPEDVGRDFRAAVTAAREAGYREYVSLQGEAAGRVAPPAPPARRFGASRRYLPLEPAAGAGAP